MLKKRNALEGGSPTWEWNNLIFNMNNDWYLLKYIKYIKFRILGNQLFTLKINKGKYILSFL